MYVCDMSVNKLYVYKKYINKKISNINIYIHTYATSYRILKTKENIYVMFWNAKYEVPTILQISTSMFHIYSTIFEKKNNVTYVMLT